MSFQGGDAERRFAVMFELMVMGVLGGLAALVGFQAYEAYKNRSEGLHDHYHE